ncbi:hypothetical protein D3C78_20270 [compost metagenome]
MNLKDVFDLFGNKIFICSKDSIFLDWKCISEPIYDRLAVGYNFKYHENSINVLKCANESDQDAYERRLFDSYLHPSNDEAIVVKVLSLGPRHQLSCGRIIYHVVSGVHHQIGNRLFSAYWDDGSSKITFGQILDRQQMRIDCYEYDKDGTVFIAELEEQYMWMKGLTDPLDLVASAINEEYQHLATFQPQNIINGHYFGKNLVYDQDIAFILLPGQIHWCKVSIVWLETVIGLGKIDQIIIDEWNLSLLTE